MSDTEYPLPCPLCGPQSVNRTPVTWLVEPRKSSFEQVEPSKHGDTGIHCRACGLMMIHRSDSLPELEKKRVEILRKWNTRLTKDPHK